MSHLQNGASSRSGSSGVGSRPMRGVGGGVSSGCPTDAAFVLPFLALLGLDAGRMSTVADLPAKDLAAESRDNAKLSPRPEGSLPGERHRLLVDRGFEGTAWILSRAD